MAKDEDTRYMMRRSLQLLLSDIRTSEAREFGIDFLPVGTESYICEAPFRFKILIILINLWTALRALHEYILPNLEIPFAWSITRTLVDGEQIEGAIDWFETITRWSSGHKHYVIKHRSKQESSAQAKYIAFVLSEVLMHSELIVDKMLSMLQNNSSPTLESMLSQTQQMTESVKHALESKFHLHCTGINSDLMRARTYLTQIITDADKEPYRIFQPYINAVRPKPGAGSFIMDTVKALVDWRNQYLSCNIWLSDKVGFCFKQKSDQAQLYELWCFNEFARSAASCGVGEIVQRSFICRYREQPEFQFGNEHYAYFDFRMSRYKNTSINNIMGPGKGSIRPALPGVHVEWFIENLSDYRMSVIMDTKYSKWNSREALKVLGYMANYGISRGAIVFRFPFNASKIGGQAVVPGLLLIRCPDVQPKHLWIMNLVPSLAYEQHNSRVLEHFIKEGLP